MELLSLVTLIVFVVVFWYHAKYKRRNELLMKIPAVKSYPLVGSNLALFGKSPVEIFLKIDEFSKKLGPVYRYDVSPFYTAVIVSDPQIAQEVLSSNKMISKGVEYDYLRSWLGDGLLLSTGQKWRQRRKLITPSFHFKSLENYAKIVEAHSEVFVENLRKREGQEVDFFQLISLFALDVICEVALGEKINAQLDSDSQYVKAVKEMTSIVTKRILNPLLMIDVFYKLTELYRQECDALRIIHDFSQSVITSRRNSKMQLEQAKSESNFIDLLINSQIDGEFLSDANVREEIDTFVFEGHDTITSAISFVLFNLAMHKDVQQKVFEEVQAELYFESSTVRDLNRLIYLEQVIKESLRLFPSIPFMARHMKEEVQIGEFIIPVDTTLVVTAYLLGRNPEAFPDPLKFDPSRFDLKTNNKASNPFAFVPFSAGPRNCIGQKFAVLEMKSFVSTVVRNFELSISKENEQMQLAIDVVLKPFNGVLLQAKARNQ